MTTNRNCRIRNNNGFSLLEAVFTVLILSIGFYASLFLTSNILVTAQISDQNIIGTELANNKTELIMADKKFKGYTYVDNTNYTSESLAEPFAGYSRSVSVVEVQGSDLTTPLSGSGLKRVNVTVSWGSEPSQQVTVTSIVSKYN